MRKNKASNLRRGRYSQVGRVYHITFITQDRAPIFSDFHKARHIISCLKFSTRQAITETVAFVVMPDHIHWLFELKFGSISQSVQRVKAQFSRQSGSRIWAAGFYDHAMRADDDVRATARYIVANPLRAGLVDNIGDYPHWDAIWL